MMTRLPHSAKWKRVKKGGNRVCQHYKSHVLARHTHTHTIYNMHIYVFLLEICRGSLVCCLFCFLAHLGAIHHSRLKFPNMQASQRTKNSVTLALSFRKNVPRYEFFKGRACRKGREQHAGPWPQLDAGFSHRNQLTNRPPTYLQCQLLFG